MDKPIENFWIPPDPTFQYSSIPSFQLRQAGTVTDANPVRVNPALRSVVATEAVVQLDRLGLVTQQLSYLPQVSDVYPLLP